MPSETEMLENVLVRAKDRKSSKKCGGDRCGAPKHDTKPCVVDCCIPDCNPDCCTAAFQRLDKLRQVWQLTQYNLDVPVTVANPAVSTVYNRAGNLISTASPINSTSWGNLELAAYAFVNEVRYLNYEECGKLDQVTGWSVDLQTGDLYFYQNLPDLGLLTTDSRAVLLNTAPTSLTPYDRRKLQEIEPFWKLSLKAVERVRENPKTEGNICEIKDKCGNRFLVAINRVDGQASGVGVCDYNSQYSIVVVKLC
jgi:hypothetical protein